MPLKTSQEELPNLNLTAMIDVVFLIILFFLLSTQFADAERQVDLKLPTVSSEQALSAAPAKRIVRVFYDGRLSLDRQETNLTALVTQLAAARGQYAGLGVMVRADARTPFQRVAEVLAGCKRAGIAELAISVRVVTEETP